MKIFNIYASLTGQTKKLAQEIEKACLARQCELTSINVCQEQGVVPLLSADLCFIGSGVFTWLPGKAMMSWIETQLEFGRKEGQFLPGSPKRVGKFVCVYCTYGGPHTGEAEALPAIQYMGQLFDHLGSSLLAEWAFPCAFVPKNLQEMNTKGRLGNISNRPTTQDLQDVYQKTLGVQPSLPEH